MKYWKFDEFVSLFIEQKMLSHSYEESPFPLVLDVKVVVNRDANILPWVLLAQVQNTLWLNYQNKSSSCVYKFCYDQNSGSFAGSSVVKAASGEELSATMQHQPCLILVRVCKNYEGLVSLSGDMVTGEEVENILTLSHYLGEGLYEGLVSLCGDVVPRENIEHNLHPALPWWGFSQRPCIAPRWRGPRRRS